MHRVGFSYGHILGLEIVVRPVVSIHHANVSFVFLCERQCLHTADGILAFTFVVCKELQLALCSDFMFKMNVFFSVLSDRNQSGFHGPELRFTRHSVRAPDRFLQPETTKFQQREDTSTFVSATLLSDRMSVSCICLESADDPCSNSEFSLQLSRGQPYW